MDINKILKTINQVDYEAVEEVVIPTKDLVKLRMEILLLRDTITTTKKELLKTRAEALKIMSREHLTPRFQEYA